MRSSPQRTRLEFSQRLSARRAEIEQMALARVQAVDSKASADPEYTQALRVAVGAAIEYGLAGIAQGERAPPIPIALLAQARLAVRAGVSLDTVLRRYFAGYTLLGDFLIEEAQKQGGPSAQELKRLLGSQAALFDRLLAAISEEYTREARSQPDSASKRRAERVQRLLDGELIDTAEFAYDFDGRHVGLIAAGPKAPKAIRELAKSLGCQSLLVPHGEGVVWAWLGSREHFEMNRIERQLQKSWPQPSSLALGEPAAGIAGWRLTHRQAKAALPIALQSQEPFIRYAEVALLAAILGDELLATSLRELYLAPLALERDGGETLRQTLRAYFNAQRNVSSAAAAIGVSRQTVINRLRVVEERLGRSLDSCGAEVDAALRLEELGP